ncbi:hypothetical protein ACP275_14G068600 [Erythranthe tilingii]
MTFRGSTGGGIKVSKLHGGDSEMEKYPETKKRINKMRKQLEKFEVENPEQRNRITKIRRQLDKLINKLEEEDEEEEEEVLDEISNCYWKPDVQPTPLRRRLSDMVLYDRRDSTASTNPYRMRLLKNTAKLAIGYFNKQSPIRYSVVDLVKATQHICSGRYFRLLFTAKPEGSEETKTFESKVYYRIGQTEVDFVKIVAT